MRKRDPFACIHWSTSISTGDQIVPPQATELPGALTTSPFPMRLASPHVLVMDGTLNTLEFVGPGPAATGL